MTTISIIGLDINTILGNIILARSEAGDMSQQEMLTQGSVVLSTYRTSLTNFNILVIISA